VSPSERPWSHDVPEGPWDYVVIGSGMGGMSAAALLAKLGKRVLILEQHTIPGGFTQTFKRPGYHWDVGVHIVGEMSDMSYPGRLLESLTEGRLAWEPVGNVYDEFHFPDGFAIQFPNSRKGFRANLIDAFPNEVAAIDEYLELVRAAARSAAKYLQMRAVPSLMAPGGRRRAETAALPHLTATTQHVLESLTDDRRLRAVLAAQWGYYGATPAHSSFAMHALMVQHFMYGAFYPVGGAASIAHAMLATVAAAGGWTAVRRSAAEIVVRRGKVNGVRLDNGAEIAARRVISAAGDVTTAALLGEPSPAGTYRESGPAHVSLYLGFTGDIEAHGAHRYCQWYYDSWNLEVAEWDIAPGRPSDEAPVLFCSFPSIKDPAHDPGPDQHHTGEAITFVPWEAFAPWIGTKWQRRGPEYEGFKQELSDRLLQQYLRHYPGLESLVDHVEMSTPLSTSHFAAADRGSIYGLGTEPARFRDTTLAPKTSVKGLYLGGADAGAPGVVGALTGGVLAAVAAEPIVASRFVQPLMRRPQPA